MPEGMNVEVAHKLAEGEHQSSSERGWEEFVEILEAIALSIIAIATAWSGYQAARWDGRQAFLYGEASRYGVEATTAATLGGQERLMDITTFSTWIQAKTSGNQEVAALFERRFSPEYKVAFDAWLRTDPFTNPDAPPGPIFMPEYHNAQLEQADVLNERASRAFEAGTAARETAERYVRGTVLLATVLFLVALSQRFKLRNVRIGLIVLTGAMIVYALAILGTYPRR